MSSPPDFEPRPKTIGPLKIESYIEGTAIADWEPAPGDTASLRLGEVRLFVRIKSGDRQQYTAEVLSFHPWESDPPEGLRVGDIVAFSYEQAFGFGRF